MTLLRAIYALAFWIIPVAGGLLPVKIAEAIRLTRPQNIPATIALSLAGARIMNPSLLRQLTKGNLGIRCIETTLIMSNSMVLNDICDIELDRVNSPARPLIMRTINKREAIGFSLLLTGITEMINVLYLPKHLRWIIHGALLYIHIYTPVLKRIPVIKNIACAVLVACSVMFSGMASSEPFFQSPNRGVLYIMTNAIFGGSWVNEILLDMRDETGDRENGIRTLTTLYGKQTAWTIAHMILYINVWMNTIALAGIGMRPFFYIGIMAPQFYMLHKIPNTMFSKSSIQSYLKYTTKTMFVLLLFLSCKTY